MCSFCNQASSSLQQKRAQRTLQTQHVRGTHSDLLGGFTKDSSFALKGQGPTWYKSEFRVRLGKSSRPACLRESSPLSVTECSKAFAAEGEAEGSAQMARAG